MKSIETAFEVLCAFWPFCAGQTVFVGGALWVFYFSEERSRLFVYYPFNLKRLESVERLRSSPLIVSLFTDGHGAGLLFS